MLPTTKKQKINPLLLKVIFISVAIHLLAGLILGSITIYKFVVPSEAQFEEPPVVEQEEPPPPVKVQIKPKQQQAQRLTMRPVATIAVANVDVNLPDMEQNFSVSGLGGIGGGSLIGGSRGGSIGMGLSDVSVFGLKTRAERVLFVIDASKAMLTDAKGGLHSYKIIKDEITDMVSNLSAGTLFNVVCYDNGRFLFFRPRPIPAGSEITQKLVKWITPINANPSKLGLRGAKPVALIAMADNPIQKQILYFKAITGKTHSGNRIAYLSQVVLEQSIDAIFIITGSHGGFQRLRRANDKRENEEWAKRTAQPDYQAQLAAFKAEIPKANKKAGKKLAKLQAKRKKQGLPPKIFASGNLFSHMGIKLNKKHPGVQPRGYIDKDVVKRYFKDFLKQAYADKGTVSPSINVVLFLASDENFSDAQEDNIRDYTRFFDGKYRVIRGLNGIQDARSAEGTDN
jgi:hypothetical protein